MRRPIGYSLRGTEKEMDGGGFEGVVGDGL